MRPGTHHTAEAKRSMAEAQRARWARDERLAGRNAEIVRLREQRLSYGAIGECFGLTREAVRLILHRMGRSDLCGRDMGPPNMPPRPCEHCGKWFQPNMATRRYCSKPCADKEIGEKLATDRWAPALDMRRKGMTWQAIAEALGAEKAAIAIMGARRYAARTGADTTGVFGARNRRAA